METPEIDALLKRLHLPTIRRLYRDLAVHAESDRLGYTEYLATLLREEVAHRGQTRIERAVRRAKFPFLRTIEEFDFTFQTSLRRQLLGSYLGPEFLLEGRNLILAGPPGTGKTHLAMAIAYRAIQNGGEATFVTLAHLLDHLCRASHEGRLREVLPDYTHPPALVIDEVGYVTYAPEAANLLYQVVNARYLHKRSMLFTTNKPIEAWGKVLHDPDLAEAILDRILERGRLLHLRGPSYRTRHLELSLRREENSPSTPKTGTISSALAEDKATPTGDLSAARAPLRAQPLFPEGVQSDKRRGRGGSAPAHCPEISGKTVPEFPEPTPPSPGKVGRAIAFGCKTRWRCLSTSAQASPTSS